MSQRIDIDLIAALVADLELTPIEERLETLKSAVITSGGRWDLPSAKRGVYEPFLMSIQVFGVYAMADSLEELPRNWVRLAANILDAAQNSAEAA
ncbi:hypothetical protein JI58_04265 [Marinosulfonomonas sp. PRT-SC04]|nr:hypothetical protein JI58_05215 [Marinosulfonomonas sp. PRT-SC04]KPU84359.1 hypothetical protein JI58_04265 [Marinosulfonomonas sp. PRT-SC04]